MANMKIGREEYFACNRRSSASYPIEYATSSTRCSRSVQDKMFSLSRRGRKGRHRDGKKDGTAGFRLTGGTEDE